MNYQTAIVYVIIAVAAALILLRTYRRITGRQRGCNCGQCPMDGSSQCHCKNTKK